MERTILAYMARWNTDKFRKPLVLMGARQVGKTWLAEEFSRLYYPSDTVFVNLMSNKLLRLQFQKINLDVESILSVISLATGKKIIPGKTLLVFDEIQESPRALTSLKFFCEQMPSLAVIAAGSLLGLAMNRNPDDGGEDDLDGDVSEDDGQIESVKTSFPVGKVDFLNVRPMTFREFMLACGEGMRLKLLDDRDYRMVEVQHGEFLRLLKSYMFVGGMPEAVKVFAETGDYRRARRTQRGILTSYDKDFAKHATSPYLLEKIRLLWNNIPSQLAKENKKFIYAALRDGARAREYEEALQWLKDAGMVLVHERVQTPRLPLKSYEDFTAFKLFFHDVGLLGAMSNLSPTVMLQGSDIFTNFNGSLTEQYVLQELVAAGSVADYWTSKSGNAEVDFVVQGEDDVFPIEAKAGVRLTAKSLGVYRELYKPRKSFRTSLAKWKPNAEPREVPLYAVSKIVEEIGKSC